MLKYIKFKILLIINEKLYNIIYRLYELYNTEKDIKHTHIYTHALRHTKTNERKYMTVDTFRFESKYIL